ncbi:MAG TPA: restriction endonuclease subunit S, partial [Allomuricauda sp.]|nr:restriction endonuclease subunit S [Allomuricauda sp.]
MNNMMAEIPLIMPLIKEQKSIASYLDTKTKQIDALIQRKERKIELLKEKRIALINRAVTKGLDPHVEMKDSGVEWIGEIPKEWEVKPLKYCVEYNKETLDNKTDPNFKLKYIEISDVSNRGTIENFTEYTFGKAPSRCRRVLNQGDIFISTVRTYLKAIGFVQNDIENLICSTGFCTLSSKVFIDSEFLFYSVSTNWFISSVISNSVGVSYPAINSSQLVQLKVIVPTLIEQKEIVAYLKSNIQELDSLVDLEEKKIKLLKEYKQSLISEVVTGKIRVYEKDPTVEGAVNQTA